ncbi:MAG: 16S rRNA (guanine(966)-N(2))-methyltransferase RsmD [Propionibacteriales bacterium]|nr:16S rRNA (guanine(966)-N(2))-methyltransferase RsmD [Propionibacteriales bacterium]
MTRIIAGTAGGRRLVTPPGDGTRPTSDRVREAVFSTVESTLGSLAGAAFLDLYAGSGAVGLEAMSRGAARALLVEHDRRVVKVARDNVATLGFGEVTVSGGRVERVVRSAPPGGAGFDAVFLDPPYPLDNDAVVAVLSDLCDHGWLNPDALVVVERSSRTPDLAWPPGYVALRARRYGETHVWYGRAS